MIKHVFVGRVPGDVVRYSPEGRVQEKSRKVGFNSGFSRNSAVNSHLAPKS